MFLIRYLVENSLEEFAQIITDTTVAVMDLEDGMEWPHKGNLAVSPYQPLKNPLFVIDLILDQEGIRYSTPLENFESTIVSVFDRGIFVTQSIPQLEKVCRRLKQNHCFLVRVGGSITSTSISYLLTSQKCYLSPHLTAVYVIQYLQN
jgi:hypothetical protein